MINYKIKHHSSGTTYQNPHFFILNKGMNTGKPLSEPCANCFVIILQHPSDVENLFCIAGSLWKIKFWHEMLIGSVIPYIRISDFDKLFARKATEMMIDFENHQKNIQTIKLLEQKEKQFNENIMLINDVKRAILYRYCKMR